MDLLFQLRFRLYIVVLLSITIFGSCEKETAIKTGTVYISKDYIVGDSVDINPSFGAYPEELPKTFWFAENFLSDEFYLKYPIEARKGLKLRLDVDINYQPFRIVHFYSLWHTTGGWQGDAASSTEHAFATTDRLEKYIESWITTIDKLVSTESERPTYIFWEADPSNQIYGYAKTNYEGDPTKLPVALPIDNEWVIASKAERNFTGLMQTLRYILDQKAPDFKFGPVIKNHGLDRHFTEGLTDEIIEKAQHKAEFWNKTATKYDVLFCNWGNADGPIFTKTTFETTIKENHIIAHNMGGLRLINWRVPVKESYFINGDYSNNSALFILNNIEFMAKYGFIGALLEFDKEADELNYEDEQIFDWLGEYYSGELSDNQEYCNTIGKVELPLSVDP